MTFLSNVFSPLLDLFFVFVLSEKDIFFLQYFFNKKWVRCDIVCDRETHCSWFVFYSAFFRVFVFLLFVFSSQINLHHFPNHPCKLIDKCVSLNLHIFKSVRAAELSFTQNETQLSKMFYYILQERWIQMYNISLPYKNSSQLTVSITLNQLQDPVSLYKGIATSSNSSLFTS